MASEVMRIALREATAERGGTRAPNSEPVDGHAISDRVPDEHERADVVIPVQRDELVLL